MFCFINKVSFTLSGIFDNDPDVTDSNLKEENEKLKACLTNIVELVLERNHAEKQGFLNTTD